MRKTLVFIVLLSCSLLVVSCSDSGPSPRPGQASVAAGSRPAPRAEPAMATAGGASLFRLPMVDGQPVTVQTPAALFFFTTWCGYCKQAMPEIKRLAERARSRGWSVYGIDVNESPSQVAGFVQQYQPNFPILMDQQGLVAQKYGVRGYPTFIVIDQNANIVYNGHEVPRNF